MATLVIYSSTEHMLSSYHSPSLYSPDEHDPRRTPRTPAMMDKSLPSPGANYQKQLPYPPSSLSSTGSSPTSNSSLSQAASSPTSDISYYSPGWGLKNAGNESPQIRQRRKGPFPADLSLKHSNGSTSTLNLKSSHIQGDSAVSISPQVHAAAKYLRALSNEKKNESPLRRDNSQTPPPPPPKNAQPLAVARKPLVNTTMSSSRWMPSKKFPFPARNMSSPKEELAVEPRPVTPKLTIEIPNVYKPVQAPIGLPSGPRAGKMTRQQFSPQAAAQHERQDSAPDASRKPSEAEELFSRAFQDEAHIRQEANHSAPSQSKQAQDSNKGLPSIPQHDLLVLQAGLSLHPGPRSRSNSAVSNTDLPKLNTNVPPVPVQRKEQSPPQQPAALRRHGLPGSVKLSQAFRPVPRSRANAEADIAEEQPAASANPDSASTITPVGGVLKGPFDTNYYPTYSPSPAKSPEQKTSPQRPSLTYTAPNPKATHTPYPTFNSQAPVPQLPAHARLPQPPRPTPPAAQQQQQSYPQQPQKPHPPRSSSRERTRQQPGSINSLHSSLNSLSIGTNSTRPSRSTSNATTTSNYSTYTTSRLQAIQVHAPPLKATQLSCYVHHRIMRASNNRVAPVPCMVCHVDDVGPRLRCYFCCLRICADCDMDLTRCRKDLGMVIERRGSEAVKDGMRRILAAGDMEMSVPNAYHGGMEQQGQVRVAPQLQLIQQLHPQLQQIQAQRNQNQVQNQQRDPQDQRPAGERQMDVRSMWGMPENSRR